MKTGAIARLCRTLPFVPLLVSCGGISIGIFFSTLDRSVHSGVDTFRAVVVSEPTAWATLWSAHTSRLTPAPPPPLVDFSTRTVVAVFLGPRPNACYAVRIEEIRTAPDRIVVYFTERRPGLHDVCAQVITTPAHLVIVERTGLPFEFIKTN
ncbi:MAG TPA: protease complex subunit PrcB family protein [Noviherbaspirillum sp.]|nr:protease complex subunit PrcB family protein [Noviherbaspirillum sp.]